MFERTQLPGGPRVISARMPGTRSLSVAVTVLVGSRHEHRPDSGLAHFMEHITFRGTQALPSSRVVSEAIEGVGGTSNASTDRETTVYWVRLPVRHAERAFHVLSELLVRPLLRDDDVLHERDIIVEEIRSYRDDPGQYVFDLFDRSFYGDTPLGREIAGDEASVADARRSPHPGVLGDRVSALEHGRGGRRRPVPCDRRSRWSASGFGTGSGAPDAWLPATSLAVHPAYRPATADRPGAPVPGAAGPALVTTPTSGRWSCSTRCSATDRRHGCSWRCGRRPGSPTTSIRSRPSTPTRACSRCMPASTPTTRTGRSRRSWSSCRGCATNACRPPELDKARAYVSGRMELRLEETRHMCSWLGSQEALHDRVLTLDEALGELEAVTPEQIQVLAQRLIRDELLSLSVISPRTGARALERALRLP